MKRREFFEKIGIATVASGMAGGFLGISCSKRKLSSKLGMNVTFETKRLMLKHKWTISRSSSLYKDDVFVYLEKDCIIGIGEAAPSLRYNETPESICEFIKRSMPLFEKCNPWEYVQLCYDIKKLE